MANIGGIYFNVLSESRPHNLDITSHPVEEGADVTDHAKLQRSSYSIEGVVTENASAAHAKMRNLQINKKIVAYHGRTILKNCLIESFTSNVDSKLFESYAFSMVITEIRIAKPSTIELLPIRLKIDVDKVGNAGRVQIR